MGYRCTIEQITYRDAEDLRSHSEGLESFLENWRSSVSSQSRERQLRLFGLTASPSPIISSVSLEKSWDLIDLLLRNLDPDGGPLSQAILGGEPLGGEWGFNIQSYAVVQQIASAFRNIEKPDFKRAFESPAFRASVAQHLWKEDHADLFSDLGIHFRPLFDRMQDVASIYKDADVCENCLLIEIS